MRITRSLVTLAILLGAFPIRTSGFTPSAPQEETDAAIVTLASPHTKPGGETFVTIMLDNVPTRPIQALKSEIDFQTDQLTYVTARMGFAAELARATLDVQSEEGKGSAGRVPAGKTRLTITLTGTNPLPNGPLVELRFRVRAALKENTLKLEHRAEATAPGGARIEKLAARPGAVHITSEKTDEAPVIFACFFYMH